MIRVFLWGVFWMICTSGPALALMDDPSESDLVEEAPVFSAAGEALAAIAAGGYDLVEREAGTAVRSLASDFSLALDLDLTPGLYRLKVLCSAPTTGSDSFWLEVNGERLPQPMGLSLKAYGESTTGFRLDRSGRTEVRLVLRERPGVKVARLDLVQTTVRADPGSVIRPALVGTHPRVFITRWDMERLRGAARDELGQRLFRWQGGLKGSPPPPSGPPKRAGWTWDMCNQALACILPANVPDVPERFEAIRRYVLGICEYDQWLPEGWSHSTPDLDLDAAYMLHGTAVAYDWLYSRFTEAERRTIREKLAHQARVMFEASVMRRMYWARTVQQNHYWFNNYAIGVAGCALYGEVPEAEMWLAWSWDRLEGTLKTFADDGGFHEGPAYWNFSMGALFRWIDLYEHTTGRQIAHADGWLRKTGYFPVHYVYPDLKSGAAMEDTWRPGVVPGMEVLHWVAGRNNDGRLFRVAELIHPGKRSTRWWTLRALAKGVRPVEGTLGELMPRLAYYPDVETYFARTSWGPEATMFAFVARPLGGHTLARTIEAYPWIGGVGHNHPAQNSFVLYGGGKELAIDPGYTLKKETMNHNTVLVDGQGQYGDGETWPKWHPGWAHIGYASTQFPYVRGEAASAYPPALGLKRFTRQMLMLDQERIVICDQLEADAPRQFTWLLHVDGDAEVRQTDEGRFAASVGGTTLQIDALTPSDMSAQVDRYEPTWNNILRPDYHPLIGRLQLTTEAVTQTPIVAVLRVNGVSERPALSVFPDLLTVTFEDSVRVGFNRTEGEVEVDGLRTDGRAVVMSPDGEGGRRARVLDMHRYRDAEGRLRDTWLGEGEFVPGENGWVPAFAEEPVEFRGDFDGDGTVGFSDFLAFARAFGSRAGTDGWRPVFDMDDDGAVGFEDFLIFAINFGRTRSDV